MDSTINLSSDILNDFFYGVNVELFGFFASLISGSKRHLEFKQWLNIDKDKKSSYDLACTKASKDIIAILDSNDSLERKSELLNNPIMQLIIYSVDKEKKIDYYDYVYHSFGYSLGDNLFNYYISGNQEAYSMVWDVLKSNKEKSFNIYSNIYDKLKKNK